MTKFKTTRESGRSDSEVVLDLVAANAPGTLITYQAFQDALNAGSNRHFDRNDVCSAVNRSLGVLAKRLKRVVRCVRGLGYRVAEAKEHQVVAQWRKDRADVQMRRGLQALEHVDWSAMDENSRRAHEGTLLLLSAMVNAQRALERRQGSIESLVSSLIRQEKAG